jgi:hypothetical protein
MGSVYVIQRLPLQDERRDKTVKTICFFLVNMDELSGFCQRAAAFRVRFIGKVERVFASTMLLLLTVIADKWCFFKVTARSRQIVFTLLHTSDNITLFALLGTSGSVA